MLNYIRKKIQARLHAGDYARMVAKGKIPDAEVSFKRLRKLGFAPKTIFDIGAYHGDFTDMCLKLWPDSSVHAFEALPDKIANLKTRFTGKNVIVNNCLVGEQNQSDVLFYADETASSVLESQEFTPKKRMNLEMIALDQYLEGKNFVPDLLKIDTQGYEYPILKGFERNIGDVQMILLELNTIEVYHHVKLAHEVILFLAHRGFVIYDITEIHRRPLDNALFQMDFLFVKESAALRSDKRWDVG